MRFTFPETRKKLMQGIDWGKLYHIYRERKDLNPSELETRIGALMADDEVKNKPGIARCCAVHATGKRTADEKLSII